MKYLQAVLAALVFAGAAHAQTACPAVDFQRSVPVILRPTTTSQTFVARQGGSYAAYQMSSRAPYPIIQSTPNFGAQLTACLPKQGTLAPLAAGPGNPLGVPSQPSVLAPSAAGGYLWIPPASGLLGFIAVLFDSHMNFVSTTTYAANAYQFALADVNGDGIPDLVMLIAGGRYTNGAIGVMLGQGGASFQPPITHELPNSREEQLARFTFSIADVNGDGKPDLVLSTYGPLGAGGISLLTGNGDGSFQNPLPILTDVMSSALALADLNGDGIPDLISLNAASSLLPSLSIQLNLGNGSFAAPASYPFSGPEPRPDNASIAIGDVNGDGIPDIVAGGLTILFGDGKGGFPRRADYLSDAGPGIVLTDLDGDGRIDIVAGVNGTPSIFISSPENPGPTVEVYFGRGNGVFWGAPATSVPGVATVDNNGLAVATADFDGDGIPDLAYSDFQRISVLHGSSTGVFTMKYQYQLASPFLGLPVWMAAADFNGDGKADLAVVVQSPTGVTNYGALFLGNGDGTMMEPIAIALPGGLSASSLAAGDFNGDGRLDLAVVVNTQNGGSTDEAIIYFGNGDGTFRQGASYAAGPVAYGIVAADFNGDGKLDLAITNEGAYSQTNGSVSILLGKGDGTFAAAPSIPSSAGVGVGAYSIVTADFNGDGKPDLAVTLSNDTTYGGGVEVLLGRGDGTFQAPMVYPANSAEVTVGDFNGDGIPDLIAGTPRSEDAYGGLGYMLGNGDGTFQPAVPFGGMIGPVVALDLNRDGKLDLAAADGQFGVAAFLNVSQPQPPDAVVSAATFEPGPIAPGSLASAFGKNITAISFAGASGASLPAQIIFSSPAQVNFLVPAGAGLGAGTASITASGKTFAAPVQIAAVAPGLFQLNGSGLAAAYAVRVSANGAQTVEPAYSLQNGAFIAAPVNLGTPGDTVYLSLFGTGIRGAAGALSVAIQGVNAPVLYAGPQGSFAGLDQVNVVVPQTLAGGGMVSVVLTAAGVAANQVTITIQ